MITLFVLQKQIRHKGGKNEDSEKGFFFSWILQLLSSCQVLTLPISFQLWMVDANMVWIWMILFNWKIKLWQKNASRLSFKWKILTLLVPCTMFLSPWEDAADNLGPVSKPTKWNPRGKSLSPHLFCLKIRISAQENICSCEYKHKLINNYNNIETQLNDI